MAENVGATVEVLGAADTVDVVSVLCETFADDPVMRVVLGSPAGFAARLEKLVTFVVTARVMRDEHLNMIGVRAAARGRGLGRAVLEAVHDLSERDSGSTGVSLVTSRDENVSLYRYFGYDLLGRADLEEGFSVWGFFRPDGAR